MTMLQIELPFAEKDLAGREAVRNSRTTAADGIDLRGDNS